MSAPSAPRTAAGAPRTARERARAELTREIKEEARRQLASVGANGLSLRAVARELGMVSSALYRYYPSRDDLLTALIIDAYNDIGEAAERAVAATAGPSLPRWLAACHAVRDWAVSRPHEYALIYGSPVPGYRAPQATVAPASRVPLALLGVLAAAVTAGEVAAPGDDWPGADWPGADRPGADRPAAAAGRQGASGGMLRDQAAALLAVLPEQDGAIPPPVLLRAVIAWTQLFGMISFELFGQFVGLFEPADALFAHAAAELAHYVGFRLPG
jgi:AcrR family transcriptional regulator